jgi:hypothetical protein
MKKVSQIASGIYQAAKKAAIGAWNWKAEWKKAMEAACAQVINKVKEAVVMVMSIAEAARQGHVEGSRDLRYKYVTEHWTLMEDTTMPCFAGDTLVGGGMQAKVVKIEASDLAVVALLEMDNGKRQSMRLLTLAEMMQAGKVTVAVK